MADIKKWIIDNNRVTAPVISIVLSLLVLLIAFYVPLGSYGGIIIFLPPVVTFFTMHYTHLYRLKLRLLASPLVFLVVLLIGVVIISHSFYTVDHPVSAQLKDGTNVYATVTPFRSPAASYNFTMYVSNSPDPSNFTTSLQVVGPATNITYTYSELSHYTAANGTMVIYYNIPSSSFRSGVFAYNFAINNGYANVSGNGPVIGGEAVLIYALLPGFVVTYFAYYELIFLLGVFIARSISHSRSYDSLAQKK